MLDRLQTEWGRHRSVMVQMPTGTGKTVLMAEVVKGGLVLREHEAARWLSREDMDDVDWLPADRTIIDLIKTRM